MNVTRLIAPAALFVTALFAIAATPPRLTPASPADRAAAAEIHRIRFHFDSVLAELPERDVSGLTADQRRHRAALIETLSGYRDAGVFPHNYDFPDRPMPYFVDRKTGTHCAVAFLLASTGREDIVRRVANADNNVFVPQLAGDTAFTSWLDANGLTLGEAARIQIVYVGNPPNSSDPHAPRTSNHDAMNVVAPVSMAASVVTALWNANGNADGHRSTVNVLGLTSGLAAVGSGIAVMGTSGGSRSLGVASAAMGAVGVALSSRALSRHSRTIAAERAAEKSRSVAEASLAPMIPMGNGSGAGLALSIRF